MNYLTIPLIDSPPINIDADLWPIIAQASDFDGHFMSQSDRTWTLAVRQNAGDHVVHGFYSTRYQGEKDRRAGILVPAEGDVVAAIKQVGAYLEFSEHLIQDCISDLPAVDLTDAAVPSDRQVLKAVCAERAAINNEAAIGRQRLVYQWLNLMSQLEFPGRWAPLPDDPGSRGVFLCRSASPEASAPLYGLYLYDRTSISPEGRWRHMDGGPLLLHGREVWIPETPADAT